MAELRVIPCEPEGVGVVELLEDALEKAKTGTYSAIAVCWVDREGFTGHGYSKLHSRSTMIGALARTQYKLMAAD